jgi:hypothetical protein
MPDGAKIVNVKVKHTGQLILFPESPEDYNRLLKKDNWKKCDYGIMTPSVPTAKTVSQFVVIQKVNKEITEEEIKDKLSEMGIVSSLVKRM